MVNLETGSPLNVPHVLSYLGSNVVKFSLRVLVLHVADRKVDLLVKTITVNKLIVFWNLSVDLNAQGYSSLVCPTAGDIFYGVSSPTHHDCGQVEPQHIVETSSVALHTHVELSQLIVAETVCSQLDYQSMRPVLSHHGPHHCSKQFIVLVIGDTWLKGHVYAVVFSIMLTNLVQTPSSGEKILAVLMEGDSHASVSEVESFLDAVTMVDIDVEVQHSGVDLEEF